MVSECDDLAVKERDCKEEREGLRRNAAGKSLTALDVKWAVDTRGWQWRKAVSTRNASRRVTSGSALTGLIFKGGYF